MANRVASSPWWPRRLRMVALAAVFGVVLACGAALIGLSTGASQVALACGIGEPQTMMANDDPAFFYPVPQGVNPPALGQFPLDYQAKTPVVFWEDLSRAQGAPAPDAFKWRWNFGDGSAAVTNIKPSHTFAKAGTYVVKVDAYIDGAWDTDFDSAEIHVVTTLLPNPPVAKLSVSTHVGQLFKDITFDDAGSKSSDGSQLKYFWNFNDSYTATTPDAKHQFISIGSTGKNIVALVVTDARGAKSVAWTEVDVYAELPTAAVSANVTSTQVGKAVSFDASDSHVPSLPTGIQIVRYEWNFGDGSAMVNTSAPLAKHTYEKAGTFNVSVNVVDSRGAYAPAQIRVLVNAAPGFPWLIVAGGGALALATLIGGLQLLREQRKQEREERERRYAKQMARSRRGNRGGPGGAGGSGQSRQGQQGSGRGPAPSRRPSSRDRDYDRGGPYR